MTKTEVLVKNKVLTTCSYLVTAILQMSQMFTFFKNILRRNRFRVSEVERPDYPAPKKKIDSQLHLARSGGCVDWGKRDSEVGSGCNREDRGMHGLVSQSCLTLCDPMDCSPPGSSVHGVSQARMLEWAAISFSRGSSWPRDRTWVSWIEGRFITTWGTRDAQDDE